MKIKPLFDNVLIKPEQKTQSENGILIPASAGERPQIGKVIAVGNGINVDGTEVGMQVKIGEKVYFNKFAGSELKIDNETVILIAQTDIVGVVDE